MLVIMSIAFAMLFSPLFADWRLELLVTNTGTGGSENHGSAILGESGDASEAYDWGNDLAYAFPPMSNSYVAPYFLHSDWGEYNGNFSVDIRSTLPDTKTWITKIKAQNPLSTNFIISWQITGSFPPYYAPILLFGANTINMLEQSSFYYASAANISSCTIQMQYDPSYPVILDPIADMLFSDNLLREVNLNQHFAVASGELAFTYVNNEFLVQDLCTRNDSIYWAVYPVPGWTGSTQAELNATNDAHSVSMTVNITRDETNSPPVLSGSLEPLSIIQNQSQIFSWEHLLYDADLDSTWLELGSTAQIQVYPDPTLCQALIVPSAGFKGCDSLSIWIYDGFTAPQQFFLDINVLPAEPMQVQNLQISVTADSSLICAWDAVTQDISGGPISGLLYDVYVYEEIPSGATAILSQHSIAGTMIELPGDLCRGFIQVIAKNE